MAAQRTCLHLRQPSASRALALKRRDDEALSVGLEFQIGLLRDPEQVQDGPIDDYPCTVSDGLQALRHAFSMNDVHNVVQRGVCNAMLTALARSRKMCRLLHMATNLAIDDRLLNEAVRVGGQRTKKATVTQALQEYVQRRKQAQILDLFGKVDFDPKYSYKQQRRQA